MPADRTASHASGARRAPISRSLTPLAQLAQLFGLCGFALAQPLFDLLGSGPTFFVAHDADRLDIVAFTAVVLAVPPLVVFGFVRLLQGVSPPAGRWAMAAVVGTLVALTVVPPVDRAVTLRLDAYVLVCALTAVLTGAAYLRVGAVSTFATFLGPAPLLFAGVFLLLSPVSTLVLAHDPDAIASPGSDATHVVVVVFDELPLGALLERDGDIDAARYPGFARLAGTSTWYRNATTVSPGTVFAVPSLLSGRYPQENMGRTWPPDEWEEPPVASRYPRSLFTMLAGSHTMHVFEWITQLCPGSICDEDRSVPAGRQAPSLPRDVAIVLQHQLLPTRFAERRLPPITGRWAGFGQDGAGDVALLAEGVEAAERETIEETDYSSGGQFEALLSTVGSAASPQLWFAHERLPHRPPAYVRDGTRYPRHFPFDFHSNQRGIVSIPYLQQFLLQVQRVDVMVERLVDRLQDEGLFDEALVVVASDHGLSFRSGGHPRAVSMDADPSLLSDVLPVPLFVKFPGQETARVDDRQAQLTDVLPTVADVLDIDLPPEWRFDGRSLAGDPADGRPLYWQPAGKLAAEEVDLDPTQLARRSLELFGRGGGPHDLYAMGPFRDLVGSPAGPLSGAPTPDATVEPLDPDAYDDVSLGADVVPVLYEATIAGVETGTWAAVAVNGRVAGTGPVIPGPGRTDPPRVKIMLDPDLLRDGRNEVDAYLVEDGGATLRPVRSNP